MDQISSVSKISCRQVLLLSSISQQDHMKHGPPNKAVYRFHQWHVWYILAATRENFCQNTKLASRPYIVVPPFVKVCALIRDDLVFPSFPIHAITLIMANTWVFLERGCLLRWPRLHRFYSGLPPIEFVHEILRILFKMWMYLLR